MGCWWAWSAATVSGGTRSLVTYRTGSPDFAAQAAAGMAKPAFSEVVRITGSLGRPAAADWKRSTWPASAAGVAPVSRRVL